jgi:hypothetical protein
VSVGSDKTATVTVDVWTRPRFSVGGIRCHRWPPASFAKALSQPLPAALKISIPGLLWMISRLKTPPLGQLRVDGELIVHQKFCV